VETRREETRKIYMNELERTVLAQYGSQKGLENASPMAEPALKHSYTQNAI
jgi:hypothetical protein